MNIEELKKIVERNAFQESHGSTTLVVDLDTLLGLLDDFNEKQVKKFNISDVLKPLPSKDAEFIYSLLPEWSKEAPKGLDPTMYGTNTQEGDQKIVDRVKEILK